MPAIVSSWQILALPLARPHLLPLVPSRLGWFFDWFHNRIPYANLQAASRPFLAGVVIRPYSLFALAINFPIVLVPHLSSLYQPRGISPHWMGKGRWGWVTNMCSSSSSSWHPQRSSNFIELQLSTAVEIFWRLGQIGFVVGPEGERNTQ